MRCCSSVDCRPELAMLPLPMRRVWRWLFALVFAGAMRFRAFRRTAFRPASTRPPTAPRSSTTGHTDPTSDVAPDAPSRRASHVDRCRDRTIPCSGVSLTSTTVLLSGVTYRLRASGVCTVNNTNNSQGDPEWHYFNIGTPRDTRGRRRQRDRDRRRHPRPEQAAELGSLLVDTQPMPSTGSRRWHRESPAALSRLELTRTTRARCPS